MAEPRISIEELVALRDGLQTTGSLRRSVAADVEAIKDLAETRLFALLMSVSAGKSAAPRNDIPSPETLLRYLMNALPSAEVKAVELAVRGNAKALEFLFALKDALFRPDVWGREPAATLPDPTARVELGVIKVALLQGALRFQLARPAQDYFSMPLSVAALEGSLDATVDAFDLDLKADEELQPPPEQRLTDTINEIERQIDQLRGTLGQLSEELRRGIKSRQPPDVAIRSAIRRLRRQMQSVEAQLPVLDALAGELDAGTAAAAIRREVERLRGEAVRRDIFARAALRDPRLDWPTTLNLTEHQIEIELISVNTTPTPSLGIVVRQMQDGPYNPPEATIVEPGHRFTALQTGPDSHFITPPPTRSVLLLIDTDRTYSIRLDPA